MKSVVWVGIVLLLMSGVWAGVQPVAVTNADESYPYPSPWDTPMPEETQPTETPPGTATPDVTTTPDVGGGTEPAPETASTDDEEVPADSTPTPTATLPATNAGQQVFGCASGTTIVIQGKTTADTLLVLYFSGRAVSAALSDHTGWYAFTLNMGHESVGLHPLQVVKRDTGKLLATHFCNIP